MLERTKKHPIEAEQVFLGILCQQAILPEIKALLEERGCSIQQETSTKPEKEWLTTKEVFPDFHAGHALRGARYREDVSQRQLAKLTGVSVQNISAMENGRRPIGKDMAKRFAKVLNTDWRLLLS